MGGLKVNNESLGETTLNISPIYGDGFSSYLEIGKKIEIHTEFITNKKAYEEFQKELILLVMNYSYKN